MTNKEKYTQAFSVLKSSDTIDLESLMRRKEMKKSRRLRRAAAAFASLALLFAGSNGIAYAATGSTWVSGILHFTTGNGSEVMLSQEDNSVSFSVRKNAQESADYVSVQDGRIYFILGDLREDVTEQCSEDTYYKYEYTDGEALRHVILIGGTATDAGWAELIFDADGVYLFNQMHVDTDGSDSPAWLLEGMHDQGVPTGSPDYDQEFFD